MSEPTTPSAVGYLLCDDLMWISRVTGIARDLGLKVVAVRKPEQLEKLVRQQAPVCVFVDLGTASAAEIVPRVREWGGQDARFVAFGSHVDVAVLAAARAAGCDPVLPRSQMAELLPSRLPAWMGAA